jgi:hypothetical protein
MWLSHRKEDAVRRSSLKMVMAAVLMIVTFTQAWAGEGWTPSGSLTAQVASRNLNPCLSSVGYDDTQLMLDGWLNLPAGLSVELTEYAGLNDSDLDGDKGDEFDLAVWKKFALSSDSYLKFRVKYINGFPVSDMNGKDLLAYDVFVGKSFNWDGGPNTVKTEVRVQYWHYVRDLSEGLVEVIPSLTHEYRIGQFTTYERLALQWNNELAPFGDLLSGQASIGVKAKLMKNLNWNVVDVAAVTALTSVDEGDPRKVEHLKSAVTTALTYNF